MLKDKKISYCFLLLFVCSLLFLSLCSCLSGCMQDQFLRAAPVSGGMGEFLMRKMGWRAGEGLGKHREGTVEPIIIDFKTDRKGKDSPCRSHRLLLVSLGFYC